MNMSQQSQPVTDERAPMPLSVNPSDICVPTNEQQPVGDAVDVSIVAPVYRNRDTLKELHDRLSRMLEGIADRYEVIFVNDACPGGSLAVLEELARGDDQVQVVSMDQNVGQHRAVLAGLRRSRGRVAVVLDADLQDPPEAIEGLVKQLSPEVDAVFAGRRGAYESLPRLATSRVFKRLLHWLCGVPVDAGMFVAMNRKMVDAVLFLDTPSPFVVAMIGCTGLPTISVPIVRSKRPRGESAYSSFQRLKTGCRAVACVVTCRSTRNRITTRETSDSMETLPTT